MKWRCEWWDLTIQPQRPSGDDHGHELADTDACPKHGEGLSSHPESSSQRPSAWTLGRAVEEQIDVPLIEQPTHAMADARMVASGKFYGIDKDGEGIVKLYRASDWSISARLERFYVTPNIGLELRFSELERPRSTNQVAEAPFKDVRFLKAATGSMNYRVPAGALSDRLRSVVIRCDITANAYAAASLRG